ncbi:MAG: putative membrane protein YfcA [Lentisphaeria bacterium]|jgi:uncharacterized membrane protein YfcA
MEYAIGIIIGSLLGLTGAGGSVFAVPLLMLLLNLSATEAMGTALCAVALSACYGVIVQHKRVLWAPAFILVAGGMLMAPLGKWLSLDVPDVWLMCGFNVLALFIAVRMWHQSVVDPTATEITRASSPLDTSAISQSTPCRYSDDGVFHLKPKCLSRLVLGGLLIGLISGVFGVGGGFLIVPFLLFVSPIPMRAAVATSLFAITLISASGFAAHVYFVQGLASAALSVPLAEQVGDLAFGDMLVGGLNAALLIKIMLSAVVGMILSQALSAYIAGPRLQRVFAVLLVAVSLFTLVWKI